MSEIKKLIKAADMVIAGLPELEGEVAEADYRMSMDSVQAFSLLAIANLLNRKVCLDCGGEGVKIIRERMPGSTMMGEKEKHCPTCEGRGRV